jgi:amino acid transporter
MKNSIFVRPVSGLVRELSIVDAAFYGVLATGTFITIIYLWPFSNAVLPGSSLLLIGLLGFFCLGIPVSIVYAGLGSAMPRSGGDYVYQSRILHPSIGFSIAFGFFSITWVITAVLGGYAITYYALQPLLLHLSYIFNIPILIDIANSLVSPAYNILITIIILLLAFINSVMGMRWYRRIQNYLLVPCVLISHVMILIALLPASHDTFVQVFNYWGQKLTGDSNLYATVMSSALAGGYVTPSLDLYKTFAAFTLPGTWLGYIVFSAMGILGEVKGARSFKSLALAFLFAAFYTSILFVFLNMYLLERVVGWDFLNAFAYAYYGGLVEYPIIPSILSICMELLNNPLLMVLLVLGTIASTYYMAICCFLNATRIWLAQSLDGLLPEWFSIVSPRFRAPINANVFHLIIAIFWTLIYFLISEMYWTVYSGANFAWIGGIVPTAIAAVVFAWRTKEIYNASPVSQYKVLGVPLITIFGVWLMLISGLMAIVIAVEPALGVATLTSYITISALFIIPFIYFWIYRAYKKKKGILVDLAFKEIPPE